MKYAEAVVVVMAQFFSRFKMQMIRFSYPNLLEMQGSDILDIGSYSENHGIIIATRPTNPKHLHLNSGNRRTQARPRRISTSTSSHVRFTPRPALLLLGIINRGVKHPSLLSLFLFRYLQNSRISGINSSKRRKRHTR
jgi:hypothetical protein